MPLKAALAALVGGVVLLVGSCAPIGLSAYRSFFSDPVSSTPLTDGAGASGPVRVAPGRMARVAIEAEIETPSVQEADSAGRKEYKPRYRFPVTYSVRDGGRELQARTELFAWDSGTRTITDEHASSTGARLKVRHSFDKFDAPASGTLEVQARLGEDSTYKATVRRADLLVFGGLRNETPWVLSGIAMLVGGFILAVVGLIFTLTAMASSSAGAAPAAAGTVAAGSESRKRATLCHLSGFLAYAVPPLNLVLAAVLWMLWREGDEFIDDQGREALNFQISLLIYYLVSAVLILVLVGFLLLVALTVFQAVFLIVAAVSSARGERYRYPMTLRILK